MKRFVLPALALFLVFVMASCAKSPAEADATKADPTANAPAANAPAANSPAADEPKSESPASQDEIYEVIMQFPTLGSTPQDLQLVEDALNKRTEPEIGVHVTFLPVSAFEVNSVTNLMISTGEKLDLMISLFESGGVSGYVNKGVLLELDELVEKYGQDIVAAEGIAMSGGYVNGKLYAVPAEEKMARVKGFLTRKDVLERNGISIDPNKIYSLEEVTEIFGKVKEGEGEGFYCLAVNGTYDMYSFTGDYLGAGIGSGVLPNYGVGSTNIINVFESEEYAESLDIVRDWYLKGYLAPDCNTITDSALAQFQAGNFFGVFSNCEPDMISGWTGTARAALGTDVVPIYTTAPMAVTQNYQTTVWGLPITCENPVKTMQWLNLLYKDQEIINLIHEGVEGVHWQFVEGSDIVIEYPEGVDGSNVTYSAILNVWGDKSKDYVRPPSDETYPEVLKAFNQSVTPEHTSIALGYCFNVDNVKTEYASVNDVLSEYSGSLGLGVVDPKNVLPEFQAALKAAGVDKLIAENQKQFDAWLASK